MIISISSINDKPNDLAEYTLAKMLSIKMATPDFLSGDVIKKAITISYDEFEFGDWGFVKYKAEAERIYKTIFGFDFNDADLVESTSDALLDKHKFQLHKLVSGLEDIYGMNFWANVLECNRHKNTIVYDCDSNLLEILDNRAESGEQHLKIKILDSRTIKNWMSFFGIDSIPLDDKLIVGWLETFATFNEFLDFCGFAYNTETITKKDWDEIMTLTSDYQRDFNLTFGKLGFHWQFEFKYPKSGEYFDACEDLLKQVELFIERKNLYGGK